MESLQHCNQQLLDTPVKSVVNDNNAAFVSKGVQTQASGEPLKDKIDKHILLDIIGEALARLPENLTLVKSDTDTSPAQHVELLLPQIGSQLEEKLTCYEDIINRLIGESDTDASQVYCRLRAEKNVSFTSDIFQVEKNRDQSSGAAGSFCSSDPRQNERQGTPSLKRSTSTPDYPHSDERNISSEEEIYYQKRPQPLPKEDLAVESVSDTGMGLNMPLALTTHCHCHALVEQLPWLAHALLSTTPAPLYFSPHTWLSPNLQDATAQFENKDLGRSYLDFYTAARQAIRRGATAHDVLGPQELDLALFFRDRTPDDQYTANNWACDMGKYLYCEEYMPTGFPVTRLAVVYLFSRLMRVRIVHGSHTFVL